MGYLSKLAKVLGNRLENFKVEVGNILTSDPKYQGSYGYSESQALIDHIHSIEDHKERARRIKETFDIDITSPEYLETTREVREMISGITTSRNSD